MALQVIFMTNSCEMSTSYHYTPYDTVLQQMIRFAQRFYRYPTGLCTNYIAVTSKFRINHVIQNKLWHLQWMRNNHESINLKIYTTHTCWCPCAVSYLVEIIFHRSKLFWEGVLHKQRHFNGKEAQVPELFSHIQFLHWQQLHHSLSAIVGNDSSV